MSVRVCVCVCVFLPYLPSKQSPCALSYCYLWAVRLGHILPHYLINGTIFWKKKTLNRKRMFSFSLQLLSETYLILRRNERGMIKKNVYLSSCKVSVILVIFLTRLEFSKFIKKNPTRCNNASKFDYSIFIWSSTCFGRHTAHHQEPKTALEASGFAYVEGCLNV